MIRIGHPRWIGAAVAFSLAAAIVLSASRSAPIRELNRGVIGRLAGEPGRVVGDGTESAPWAIERREVPEAIAPPQVLFLDDDPEGYFETVPPPPADLMVALARLRDAGLGAIGIGYPLQWERPDTLALETLRRTMDRYDRTVIGYVVKDSTAPVPVPPPLLAASMPYAAVAGDAAKLPVVNGVVGIAPEFGGDRCWGGFTRIETEEPEEGREYLLARWSDRVIFSLPLALEIARRGLSPETDVRVTMGREVALGDDGPRIPIDFRGRVALPADDPARLAVPATAVISGTLPAGFAGGGAPVFLTDERLLGDKANRRWAERLARLDAAVRRSPVMAGRTEMPPWPLPAAILSSLALAVGGAWLIGHGRTRRRLGWALALGAGVAGLLAAMLRGGIGAPMPVALLAVPAVLLLAALVLDAIPEVEVVRSDARKPVDPTPAPRREAAKPRRRRRKG